MAFQITCLRSLTVCLKDGTKVSVDIAELIAEGIPPDEVEFMVNARLQALDSIIDDVDFYISPTLSIMNAKHLPEFHRAWAEAGLIKPQDLNVNILQDPAHYRIDIATKEYKEELSTRYLNHIMWLREQGDHLGRATQGFESAITFMNATDNSHLIPKFWAKTKELDLIRNENILEVIPELAALK